MSPVCRRCANTRGNGGGHFFWHLEQKYGEPVLFCEPCFDAVLEREWRHLVTYPFAGFVLAVVVALVLALAFGR